MPELVGGKSQDNKLIPELGDQLVHLGEVPDCRASERGHVLDEHDAPLQLGKAQHLPIQLQR